MIGGVALPESVFTNKNFSYDKTWTKWRGKLIWRDADNKRHWIVRTFQQSGKRAAYSEFLQWVEEEEEAWRKKLTEGDISEISRMNVPDYVSSFIDSKEGAKVLEPATIKSYRSTVKYISNGLDGVELRELNARMVNDWMADLLSSGLSSLTVGSEGFSSSIVGGTTTSGFSIIGSFLHEITHKRTNKAVKLFTYNLFIFNPNTNQ